MLFQERNADIAAKEKEYSETKAKIAREDETAIELQKQNQECDKEYTALNMKDCELEKKLKSLRLEYDRIMDQCEGNPIPLVRQLQSKIQQVR